VREGCWIGRELPTRQTVQESPQDDRTLRMLFEPEPPTAPRPAQGRSSRRWLRPGWFIAAVIISLALIVPASAELDTRSIVIEQPGSPIDIVSYESGLARGSRISMRGSPPVAIQHQLRYANPGTELIVAVQFGFVGFSVFDEFLSHYAGLAVDDLEPAGEDEYRWVFEGTADFSYLTGAVFVRKVRFESDRIWEADMDAVAESLETLGDTVGFRDTPVMP